MDRIFLNKNVFRKEEFNHTIDTSFKQLISFPLNEIPEDFTVDNFFEQYEKLFFEISKEGDINSHEYLVKRSGDYINYEINNEEIQALLDEISDLRQEILNLNQTYLNLELTQEVTETTQKIRQGVNPTNSITKIRQGSDPYLSNTEKIRKGSDQYLTNIEKIRQGAI